MAMMQMAECSFLGQSLLNCFLQSQIRLDVFFGFEC